MSKNIKYKNRVFCVERSWKEKSCLAEYLVIHSNRKMDMGATSELKALQEKCGERLLDETTKLDDVRLLVTEVHLTGSYNLAPHTKRIVHAMPPEFRRRTDPAYLFEEGRKEEQLAKTLENVMASLNQDDCTVAFTLLSKDLFYDVDDAAKVLVDHVMKHLEWSQSPGFCKKVYFLGDSLDEREAFTMALQLYFLKAPGDRSRAVAQAFTDSANALMGEEEVKAARQRKKEYRMMNLQFHLNKLQNLPASEYSNFIDEIHKWKGQYEYLEHVKNYIQWLFPTKSRSRVNPDAVPLTKDEAYVMRNNSLCRERVLRSFEMMLDFYGMKISRKTGTIERSEDYLERMKHLSSKAGAHNVQRITRILRSLPLLSWGEWCDPFIDRLFYEVFQKEGQLQTKRFRDSFVHFWIPALRFDDKRRQMLKAVPAQHRTSHVSIWAYDL